MPSRSRPILTCLLLGLTGASASAGPIAWQPLSTIVMARTETTVGQFRRFADATGRVTEAERRGGGQEFTGGWRQRPGWTWRAPFGQSAADDEPAVHLTWPEAQAFCRWAGGRLPTDGEWLGAAYTEQRDQPAAPFVRGSTYPYPTGNRAAGAHCQDCGTAPQAHRAVGTGAPGVNGLHDMGGNAWEWVDHPAGAAPDDPVERRTRGGSWWYGEQQMRADHLQGKPPMTAVVYIGFRCARDYVR